MRRVAVATIGGLLLSTTALSTTALAQDASSGSDAREQSASSGVQEIIVTAQRRSQTLTKVPLSIAAATGEQLASSGIESISDVKFSTPGFISQSGTGYTQIYIRGIGNGVFVGADPSVATFVDDVPRVYGSMVEDLINVERVEILKGAQGGLYGRNASGGVVNIYTRQPSDEFSVKARVTGANRETVQASAYANVPLSDRAAWNVVATRNSHGPYRKNVAFDSPYTGADAAKGFNTLAKPGELNNQDVWSFDSKLRVDLADNFKVTLAGDYSDDSDAGGNGWLNTTPERTYGTYRFLAGLLGLQNPVGPWPTLTVKQNKSYGSIPNKSWTEDYGVSAKGELGLESVDLLSITAYRWNNSQFQGDIGAGPVPIAGFSTNFQRQYFYQELRAVSDSGGGFEWLGGASYFEDKIDASITGITLGLPGRPTVSKTKTKNWSVYGQVSYDFTERLTLSGSLRYANEKKSVSFPAPNPITNTSSVDKFIPAATLSYDVNNGTVYARYALGFKTGGPNPLVRPDRIPGETTGLILAPETVDTFEIGYRDILFDGKVQFTSAIFYNEYKGIHVTTSGAGAQNSDISNALINLGEARTYGVEAAIVWSASDVLTLSANLGYLNAKYKKAVFPGNAFLLPLNASGRQLILAPEWQGGAQASFEQPISDDFKVSANLLYSYISSHVFRTDESATAQKGYSLVNARLGLAKIDDTIGIYAFANNLFDERHIIFGTTNAVGEQITPGSPRIFGLTLEVNY